ncbi:MAG TPA: class I SAM-dependent methyltransferase [Dehalococcoidia bacterium]|nr:class I SAM-dependent methyltransferase [Dehalococcoidia bacterium]
MEEFVYDVYNEEQWWWSVGRRALVNKLWRRYGNHDEEPVVLDIGCGAGTTLKEMGRVGRGYGLDVSETALRYCSQRGIDTVCMAEAASLPYKDEQFNFVISVDVLEHVQDDVGAIREMYRVAKPGGLIVFTVPAFQLLWSRRDEQCHHVRRYRLGEVKAKAAQAGLRIVRTTYVNLPLLVPLFLLVKVGHMLHRNPSTKMDYVLVPPLINKLLGFVVRAEARWLSRLNLPLGTSVCCVAVKPARVSQPVHELTGGRAAA